MAGRRKLTKDQKRKKKLAERAKKGRAIAAEAVAEERARLKLAASVEEMQRRLEVMWSPDKVDEMSTDAIVEKLAELGVRFDAAGFADAIARHYSSDAVYRELWRDQTKDIKTYDGDFPWCAAIVLWQRLHPDVPSEVCIDDRIVAGYDRQREDGESPREADWAESLTLWSEAWDGMRRRLPEDVRSESQIDEVHGGMYPVAPWLDDFAARLSQIGDGGPRSRQLITVCNQVCQRLPDADDSFLKPFRERRAAAEQRLRESGVADELNTA